MKRFRCGMSVALAVSLAVLSLSPLNAHATSMAAVGESQLASGLEEPEEGESSPSEDAGEPAPENPLPDAEALLEDLDAVKVQKGTYRIRVKGDSSLSIGVKSSSVMSGAAARLEKYEKLGSQKWVIKPASGKCCYILNAKSGKALTVATPKNPKGSAVCQKTLVKSAAQTWQLRDNGDGFIITSALKGDYCLSAGTSSVSSLKLKSYALAEPLIFTLRGCSYSLGKNALLKAVSSVKSTSSITAFGGARFDKASAAGKRLQSALSAVRSSCGTCAFLMMDLETGAGVCSNAGQVVYGASTIKAPYVAAICKYAPSRINASAKSHIAAVASWSSNDDYKALRSRFGSGPMASFKKYCGVTEIDSGSTWVSYSPKALGKFWVGTYWFVFEDQGALSSYLKGKLKMGASSFIKSALSSKRTTYKKAGWGSFPRSGSIYDDAGIVVKNGHPYLVVVMSKAYCNKGKLENLVRAIDGYYGYVR